MRGQASETGAPIRAPTLIVCDFDNTLVESEKINADLFAAFFERRCSIRADEEDRAYVDSVAFVEVIRHFIAKYPAELSGRREIDLIDGFLDFKRESLESLATVPTATGLDSLFALGIPLAIVSGSFSREIEDVSRSAGIPLQRFHPVLGSDHYYPWKPDPTGLLNAAKHHGVTPADVWVLEDSGTGLQAALNAGMHPVYIDEFSFLGMSAASTWTPMRFATVGAWAETITRIRANANMSGKAP